MIMASLIMLIPKENHVTRFHPTRHFDSNTHELLPDAFTLREDRMEKFVSCAWVEYSGNKNEDDEKRDITRNMLKETSSSNSIRKGVYSTLKVETIYNVAQNLNEKVRVTHEPSVLAPSHAGIYHSNSFRLTRDLAREATKNCKQYP